MIYMFFLIFGFLQNLLPYWNFIVHLGYSSHPTTAPKCTIKPQYGNIIRFTQIIFMTFPF